MSSEISAHHISNVVALLLAMLAGIGVWSVLRHPFWGVRLRGLFQRRFAMGALICMLLFVAVAWLDAISWKDKIDASAAETVPFEAQLPRSLLDRLFARVVGMPEYKYREKSYAAPLAKTEFIDKSITLKHRHLLGTTQTGYDTLYRVLKGCKPAVVIGVLPLLVAVPLALLFGISAGFFGGKVDDGVVYVYSTLASVPDLLLLIALITALGQGLPQVAVGLGVTGWIGLCRLVRGETLKLRELEFIQAAVCLGVPRWKIILRHIIPNLGHIVMITAILAFTGLVLTESILSYLGIGLKHSWGAMIDNARGGLAREPAIWWNIVFASTALFMLVLVVNVVGDALRDILDPRTAVEEMKED